MADAWTQWAMALDDERENMREELGKGKEAWKSLKRQMTQVKKQYSEAKGQLGHLEKGMFKLEDKNKKNAMKIDVLEQKVKELQVANEKLDKNKSKLSTELEDVTHVLDTQRSKILELEKNQRNSEKMLAEEQMNSEPIKREGDHAKKETKELGLNWVLENKLGPLKESLQLTMIRPTEVSKRCVALAANVIYNFLDEVEYLYYI